MAATRKRRNLGNGSRPRPGAKRAMRERSAESCCDSGEERKNDEERQRLLEEGGDDVERGA